MFVKLMEFWYPHSRILGKQNQYHTNLRLAPQDADLCSNPVWGVTTLELSFFETSKGLTVGGCNFLLALNGNCSGRIRTRIGAKTWDRWPSGGSLLCGTLNGPTVSPTHMSRWEIERWCHINVCMCVCVCVYILITIHHKSDLHKINFVERKNFNRYVWNH